MNTISILASGSALAGIPVLHWLLVGRSLAVSGRFSAIVNRVMDGPAEPAPSMTEAELAEAMEAMALAAFGEEAVGAFVAESADDPTPEAAPGPAPAQPQPIWLHLAFLFAIAVGGLLAALLLGGFALEVGIRGDAWATRHGASFNGLGALALLVGGACVGFGTRMSGGCTSGHGLCGVSRFEVGSLLATATFFSVGIVTTWLLSALVTP